MNAQALLLEWMARAMGFEPNDPPSGSEEYRQLLRVQVQPAA